MFLKNNVAFSEIKKVYDSQKLSWRLIYLLVARPVSIA